MRAGQAGPGEIDALPGRSSPARSTASRPAPARNSPCCRSSPAPATSPRSSSGSRCASPSIPASPAWTACARACRPRSRCASAPPAAEIIGPPGSNSTRDLCFLESKLIGSGGHGGFRRRPRSRRLPRRGAGVARGELPPFAARPAWPGGGGDGGRRAGRRHRPVARPHGLARLGHPHLARRIRRRRPGARLCAGAAAEMDRLGAFNPLSVGMGISMVGIDDPGIWDRAAEA